MKLIRYSHGMHTAWGRVEGEEVLQIRGDLFHPGQTAGPRLPLSEVEIMAPTDPRKVLIIAANYAAHARETGKEVPPAPVFVSVSPQAVIAHGASIHYVPGAKRIDFEAELVAVIGKPACKVGEADALNYVAGYTCGLDISNRDVQWGPLKNISAAKSFDTFKPCGPFVETELNPQDLDIVLRQNGEIKQQSNTSDMVFSVARLVSDISHCMTLLPGDLIYTGTPSGIGSIAPGDRLEVEISGLGTLQCNVVEG